MTSLRAATIVLGMGFDCDHDAGTVSIDQAKYTEAVLEKCDMAGSKPVTKPASGSVWGRIHLADFT